MATLSALQRRAKKLRQGVSTSRRQLTSLTAGNNVYPGGNTPNPSGSNGTTPYYDAEYDLTQQQIEGQRGRLQAAARTGLSRSETAERENRQELGRLRRRALEENEYTMADQGLVRSGINVGEQADIGKDYMLDMQDLARQFAQQREDVESELAMGEADLNQDLLFAQLERGEREKEWRLRRAELEAQIEADKEALEATREEIKLLKAEKKPKASASGKFIPAGTVKKKKNAKAANKKVSQAQAKRIRQRKRRRLAKKKKKK